MGTGRARRCDAEVAGHGVAQRALGAFHRTKVGLESLTDLGKTKACGALARRRQGGRKAGGGRTCNIPARRVSRAFRSAVSPADPTAHPHHRPTRYRSGPVMRVSSPVDSCAHGSDGADGDGAALAAASSASSVSSSSFESAAAGGGGPGDGGRAQASSTPPHRRALPRAGGVRPGSRWSSGAIAGPGFAPAARERARALGRECAQARTQAAAGSYPHHDVYCGGSGG